MPRHSALRCVSGIRQDNAKPLISNGLRFIVTCLPTAALWVLFHCLRNSFASLITLEAGVPIETISRMLGHSDITTTQVYARVTPKKLFEDMDKYIEATKDLKLVL